MQELYRIKNTADPEAAAKALTCKRKTAKRSGRIKHVHGVTTYQERHGKNTFIPLNDWPPPPQLRCGDVDMAPSCITQSLYTHIWQVATSSATISQDFRNTLINKLCLEV